MINMEKAAKLMEVVSKLESTINTMKRNNEFEIIGENMELLKDSINRGDYQDLVYYSYKIVNTKSAREFLDDRGVIDKDVEELLDLIRADIVYYNNLNEIEMTLINDEEDFTQVKYTKNNKESTCPSWLRDIVK